MDKSIFQMFYLYIKYRFKMVILLMMYAILFIIVFTLYSIKLEAVSYAFILSGFLTLILSGIDFSNFYYKHKLLCHINNNIEISIDKLPIPKNILELDYQDSISKLFEIKNQLITNSERKHSDIIDYYSLWAHQIKTPIAAMRLLIQSEQNELTHELMVQLKNIEQYVEMVLGYLRIESPSSDFKIKKYDLSHIVKQAIRKYSHFFISKNIKLEFEEHPCLILTDEKWTLFVIEQILINALKYTHQGTISITINCLNKTLHIKDSGIGIAEEDLPRIFEKGFTGFNGRWDKLASGIGLYLSKKILDKLSHKIDIESAVGIGTIVKLDFYTQEIMME